MKDQRLSLCFLTFIGLILITFTVFDDGIFGERALIDEIEYYYPSIIHFFNGLSIDDYPAAVAPAYFYLMSLLSDDIFTLKIANIVLNVLFLYYIINLYNLRSLKSLLLLAPICTSLYFVSSALWLSPDNASFFASLIALHCYYKYRHNTQHSILMLFLLSAALTLAVWTRQTNLYLIGAIFLTEVFTYQRNHKIPQLLITVLPPLLTLSYLFITWKGLTPPSFARHQTASLNTAAISHFFSLFFFYGIWFLAKPAYVFFSENKDVLVRFLIMSLIFSILFTHTQNSIDTQRLTGGIVTFARLSPDVMGYNLFSFLTCFLGFGLFMYSIQGINKFDQYFIIFTSLTFFISLTANIVIYERYYSMFIYLVILHISYIRKIKSSYTLIPLIVFNFLVTVYKIGLI